MTAADPRLLGEADVLLLLSDLLAPPGQAPSLALTEAASAGPVFFERAAIHGAPDLAAELATLVALAAAPDRAAEHTRLFDGAVACPINESAWERRSKGAILGDVAAFYRAFGFDLDPACHEKADHLGALLEYLALLRVMEHLAVRDGDTERAAITRSAAADFATEHVHPWIGAFCERLAAVTTSPFYGRLAFLIAALWGALAADLPVPDAVAAPAMDTGTPYECGMAAPDPSPPQSAQATAARSDAR